MRRAPSRLAVLALLCTLGHTAGANVWDDAVARGKPDPAQDTYNSEMRSGDEHAMLANAHGLSPKEARRQIQLAVTSYKNAAAAKPKEGEPYFRIGRTLYSFFLECNDAIIAPSLRSTFCSADPRAFDRKHAEQVIEAWNEFEKLAPLDPRFTVSSIFGETEILFRRAILHTKLATRAHLEAASGDYEKILARQDAAGDGVNENVVGNLAETYMMLNRMDEAIEMYKVALRGGGAETSTWYGFAVALDRDERTQQAIEVIQSLGEDQRNAFHRKVIAGDTFFVPEGEKHYYFALSDEAFGLDEEAIDNWKKYIASGAHPEFRPRAKAHLDALLSKRKRKGVPFEPPWRGILR